MFYQAFYRTIGFDILLCSFRAYSGNAWNVVRCIALHAQHITHLVHAVYAPFFFYFFHTHNINRITHESRFVEQDLIIHQLSEILVGSHHIHRKSFFFSFFGYCTNNVVGLVGRKFKNRDIKCFNNFFNYRYSFLYIFGSFLPVRFIFFINLVPESGPR